MTRTTASLPPYIDPAIRDYLADARLRNHSPETLRLRRGVLHLLSKYLRKPLCEATEPDLHRWYLRLAGNKVATRAAYGRSVQAFYSWAAGRRLITDNPALGLPIPKVPMPMPRPMSAEDLQLALANADDRMRLWLLLAAGAGMRACEISRMCREDLAVVDGRPVLTIPLGKGNKARALVISEYLAAQISGWRSGTGRMWRMTPASVSDTANRYLHGLGIVSTLHKARSAFATEYFRGSRDLLATMRALGHSNPTMVSVYALSSPEAQVDGLIRVDTLLRGEAA